MNRSPFCFSLKDDSGEFVGALVNLVKVEFFTGAVTDAKTGQTGYPYVVNAAGMIIIHPKKEFINNEDIGKIPEMADIFEAIGSTKKGVATYRFKGVDKIAGFAFAELTDWSLVVTQNEDEFLAASHAIRNAIAIIGGIFLSLTNLPFSDGLGKKAKGLLKKAAPAKKKAQTDPEQMNPLASADELENF